MPEISYRTFSKRLISCRPRETLTHRARVSFCALRVRLGSNRCWPDAAALDGAAGSSSVVVIESFQRFRNPNSDTTPRISTISPSSQCSRTRSAPPQSIATYSLRCVINSCVCDTCHQTTVFRDSDLLPQRPTVEGRGQGPFLGAKLIDAQTTGLATGQPLLPMKIITMAARRPTGTNHHLPPITAEGKASAYQPWQVWIRRTLTISTSSWRFD